MSSAQPGLPNCAEVAYSQRSRRFSLRFPFPLPLLLLFLLRPLLGLLLPLLLPVLHARPKSSLPVSIELRTLAELLTWTGPERRQSERAMPSGPVRRACCRQWAARKFHWTRTALPAKHHYQLLLGLVPFFVPEYRAEAENG